MLNRFLINKILWEKMWHDVIS